MRARRTISIVIPAYNEERNIEDALLSMTLQSREPDEIIVVDDNSEDNTAEIAREYADTVIELEERKPVGLVRDIGIDKARSDIIFSTDADVILKERTVELILHYFNTTEDLQALSFSVMAKPDEAPVERFFTGCSNMAGLGAATSFKKSAWKKVGGYGERGPPRPDDYIYGEGADVKFWEKIEGKKKYVDKPMIMAEVHELKTGMLPVLVGCGSITTLGHILDYYNRELGKPIKYIGAGGMLGELGHQFIEGYLKNNESPLPDISIFHHDTIGIIGLLSAEAYDILEGLPENREYMFKMIPTGLALHHLVTEGFTPVKHYDRRSILDKDEIGRYTSKKDIEKET